MPELRTLIVGDETSSWIAAGFDVDQSTEGRGEIPIGGIRIRLTADGRTGIVGWELVGAEGNPIDGIPTAATTEPAARGCSHPNGVTHLDHVVMITPDLERTMKELETSGFEARRTRVIPSSVPERCQVFYWAGATIIELVGPTVATGTGPSVLWGLAATTADIDVAAERLGPALGPVKDAVQAGRRIATVRTRDIGMSVPLALMSPHRGSEPNADGE